MIQRMFGRGETPLEFDARRRVSAHIHQDTSLLMRDLSHGHPFARQSTDRRILENWTSGPRTMDWACSKNSVPHCVYRSLSMALPLSCGIWGLSGSLRRVLPPELRWLWREHCWRRNGRTNGPAGTVALEIWTRLWMDGIHSSRTFLDDLDNGQNLYDQTLSFTSGLCRGWKV